MGGGFSAPGTGDDGRCACCLGGPGAVGWLCTTRETVARRVAEWAGVIDVEVGRGDGETFTWPAVAARGRLWVSADGGWVLAVSVPVVGAVAVTVDDRSSVLGLSDMMSVMRWFRKG